MTVVLQPLQHMLTLSAILSAGSFFLVKCMLSVCLVLLTQQLIGDQCNRALLKSWTWTLEFKWEISVRKFPCLPLITAITKQSFLVRANCFTAFILFESLNKSGIWMVIQMSGTRLFISLACSNLISVSWFECGMECLKIATIQMPNYFYLDNNLTFGTTRRAASG